MDTPGASWRISIAGIDDDEERDRQTRLLRTDLAELGVGSSLPSAPAPAGTRGIDATEIGQLIAAVPPTLLAVEAVVRALRDWISAGRGRKVTVEVGGDRLELEGATPAQQDEVVTAWLGRRQAT